MSSSPLEVFEHSYYIGNTMGSILYGVSLVVYFATIQGLLRNDSRNSPRARTFFGVYTTSLIVLLTIDVAVNAVWGEEMWITARKAPGGVEGFIQSQVSVWYQTLGSTSVVAMIFIGDSLLIYRLYLIWGSRCWIVVLPILAYLAAFALALIELVLAGEPHGNFFGGKTLNFGTPYYAITISLNVIVTVLICYRLYRMSRAVTKALGKESARIYTSATSMLVESAAPYSLVGLMFLIPYARGSQTAISFGQVWAKLTCIAPLLIVYRIVTGTAWGKGLVTKAESTAGIELQNQVDADLAIPEPSADVVDKWEGDQSAKSVNSLSAA